MKAVYRNNIIQRMGGEPGFDFLVATFCENIQDDESLDVFFANFDLNTLICLQKELLLVSFLEPCEETEPRKKRVMFRNDMMGIDRSYFPQLEEHFVYALEDCCIGGLDFELCKAYFSELHALFKDRDDDSKYREDIVERMGGESTLAFLVMSYCERLEEDARLQCYFQNLNTQEMTLFQKELILMAFLYPSAKNDFEAVRLRVASNFSPLFARGMKEEHFEMMESHFSAAAYDCLTETDVIEGCMRLFGNLMTFFEDNCRLSNGGYGECEDEDEDEDIQSDTEFDEEDESLAEDGSVLSPMPPLGYLPKRIQDSLSQSERSTDSLTIRSFDSRSSSMDCESYVSRRIQEALEKSERSAHSVSMHSRTLKKEGSGNGSERTEDTLSIYSEDSKSSIQSAHVRIPKMGRAKMSFSWKNHTARGKKQIAQ